MKAAVAAVAAMMIRGPGGGEAPTVAESGEMEKEGREEGGKRGETASAAMKKAEEREPGGLQRGEQSSGRAVGVPRGGRIPGG